MSDRYILSKNSGFPIEGTSHTRGGRKITNVPYEISVLDTAYCHRVVGSFPVHRNWRLAYWDRATVEAKQLCDRLNAEERQWERENADLPQPHVV